MKLILQRISQDDTQTIGRLFVIGCGDVKELTTVELAWKDNKLFESCIPAGRYPIKRVPHPDFRKSIFIQDVPGRTGIFMHSSNYYHELKGCIAPGNGFKDTDYDGHVDVVNSRLTIDMLYDTIGDTEAVIEIYDPLPLPEADKFAGKETGYSMGVS